MATIRYFIPEDGDIEAQPNVFLAPKPRQQGFPPTLGQIKQSFPLPGHYHFRFKAPLVPGGDRDKNSMSVWMDCVDENKPVPTWQSTIVAKVTRIGIEEDEDFEEDFQRMASMRNLNPTHEEHHHASPAPAAATMPPKHEPHFDVFGGSAPAQAHQSAPPRGHVDLMSGFGGGAPASNGHHPDILGGMGGGGQQQRAPPQHQHSGGPTFDGLF